MPRHIRGGDDAGADAGAAAVVVDITMARTAAVSRSANNRLPTGRPPIATTGTTSHRTIPRSTSIRRQPSPPPRASPSPILARSPRTLRRATLRTRSSRAQATATQVRDGHHRRRRRRRGRGRNREGRGDGQQQPPQHPPQHRDGGNRDQHRDPQVRGPQHGERRHDRRDQRRRGHGSPRDVDVVPRYRDRRGKVEVIEPAALDLSAFDVELDPKRVPTFGSIVEGKDRPKKRPPRLPDTTDDYKPPPPPGSDKGPASPPPPPSDSPDTFGDW
jgi:hypothetical protein